MTSSGHYLDTVLANFRGIRTSAERAMEQLDAEDLHWSPDPESNSIAMLVKHIAGAMTSRWTDFLTTDGEKKSRERDAEFIDGGESIETLMAIWEKGWDLLFDGVGSLAEEDLLRVVTIRGEAHTVVEAINRQLLHNSLHVGQIVYIAKHRRSASWRTLSIPRGKSAEFTPAGQRGMPAVSALPAGSSTATDEPGS
ncbi:MAG: hypothetical protein JWQ98_767 [Chlorobi bacterium]|nr:hypothetical protein [Chlorobiota bacterium]